VTYVLLVIAACLGAAVVVLMLSLPWLLTVSILVLLIATTFPVIRRHILLSDPRSPVALSINADNQWRMMLRSGEEINASLQPDYFVTPGLIVMNFELLKHCRCSLVLFGDSAQPDVLRKLRIILKSLNGT